MRTLLLMRHAKSSWDDPRLSDHQRPLNKRGRRDAPRMGALLAEQDLVPDDVLCSTAVRTRETAVLLGETIGATPVVRYLPELYLASSAQLVEVAAWAAPEAKTLMLVAHNPGLEELVSRLARGHHRMPTAAIAALHLDLASWAELTQHARATLRGLWRPKDLD